MRLDLTGFAAFTRRRGASATLMLIVAVLMGVVFWLVESNAADPCQRETPELMKPVAHCFINPPTSNE
jgi:hypothetical protein